MLFREMTQDDVAEAARLYVKTFNAPPWNDRWTWEVACERLGKMLRLEDSFGLCMYDEAGTLCAVTLGAAEKFFDGVEFWIKEFAVDHARKGQGLGGQMMTELKARLKARGVKRVCLITMHGRPEHFYLCHGYRENKDNLVMFQEL